MPTIQLARLQQEAALLSEHFAEPEAYLRGLERMLQTYAVPVHRQGRVKGMRPVLMSYEVPPPLIRQLQLELSLQAKEFPQQAFAVADGLWARRTIETRLLAARLLGAIAPTDPRQITERLEAWGQENREEVLMPELIQRATLSLCALFPEELLAFAGHLLVSGEHRLQALGLGTLQTLLSTTAYANLPAFFEMLAGICADPPKKLRPDLADLLVALAARSPKETEYFLEQRLTESSNEGAQWLARQVIKVLPEESRVRLRGLIKA